MHHKLYCIIWMIGPYRNTIWDSPLCLCLVTCCILLLHSASFLPSNWLKLWSWVWQYSASENREWMKWINCWWKFQMNVKYSGFHKSFELWNIQLWEKTITRSRVIAWNAWQSTLSVCNQTETYGIFSVMKFR